MPCIAPKRTLVEQVSKECVLPPAYFFRSSEARLRSAPVFRQISIRSLAQLSVRVEDARHRKNSLLNMQRFFACRRRECAVNRVAVLLRVDEGHARLDPCTQRIHLTRIGLGCIAEIPRPLSERGGRSPRLTMLPYVSSCHPPCLSGNKFAPLFFSHILYEFAAQWKPRQGLIFIKCCGVF